MGLQDLGKKQSEITPSKQSDLIAGDAAAQKTLLISQTQNNSIDQINIIDQASPLKKESSQQQSPTNKRSLTMALAASSNAGRESYRALGQEESYTFNNQSNQHLVPQMPQNPYPPGASVPPMVSFN